MKRKHFLFLFPFIIAFLVSGCAGYSSYSKSMFLYSTNIDVNLYSKKEKCDDHLKNIVDIYKLYDRLAEYNYSAKKLYNLTNVYDINHQPLNEPLEISKELYDMINEGINYYSLTNGEFNIALGYASYKWKECIDNSTYVNLSEYIINNSYCVDIDALSLTKENGYFITRLKDVQIDLGGIAKGYVNKIVLNYLKENNIDSYLINSGSSSIMLGNHPDKRPFRVGLIDPTNTSNLYKTLELSNVSLTTSGDYESCFTYDNQFYHHILSKSLDNKYYYHSLSVVTSDPLVGDVLSTALFNVNIDEAKEMCKRFDADAIFYMNDGSIVKTDGFNYEKA